MTAPLGCAAARLLVEGGQRGPLSAEEQSALRAHLASCRDCVAYERSERALSELLEQKVPRPLAPRALRDRIAAMTDRPTGSARRPIASMAFAAACVAVVAVVALHGAHLYFERASLRSEAVNDHVRVLEAERLTRVTGGLHEVKPWFAGKLDFAPDVVFAGDADFVLEGGTVERFLDRRAAVFGYRRRLHSISMFVVRADGLPFPTLPSLDSVRGFTIVLWEARGQGFALVSDLNGREMIDLERRITEAEHR